MKTKTLRVLLSVVIASAATIWVSNTAARGWRSFADVFSFGHQTTAAKVQDQTQAPISIKAARRGFPHLNFADGKDAVSNSQQTSGAPAIAFTSADFNSDGTKDLVTADGSGTLRVYRGNPDTIYPNSPSALQKKAQGMHDDSPFNRDEKTFSLDFTPDFLASGDFNADGNADLLATARNAGQLLLLVGDGQGSFAAPRAIELGGRVTAFTVGEIGRSDGQTDVVVGIVNKNGSQLLIFEHPESAFKHKPEIFGLPSAANDLSIGHLDHDSYGDVAVANGSNVTIVHGRGQAYPLDLKADLNIKRPAAFMQTRQFGFHVSALAIGKFTASRGDSLALLATDGSIYTLEPQRQVIESALNKRTSAKLKQTMRLSFAPAEAEQGLGKLATLKIDLPRSEMEADQSAQLMVGSTTKEKDREKLIREKFERSAAEFAKLSKVEQSRITAERIRKTEESTQRRKEGFEQTLSSRPIPLTKFSIEPLISNSRLVNAARSNNAHKIIAARVSDSGKDDLVVVDSIGSQIHIVAQIRAETQQLTTEITSLDSETAPLAVLPMRLNSDALTDLVVLRENATAPSVLITEPAHTFVVTTTDDSSGGACDGSAPCALRRAMFLANVTGGADLITFNIGGGGVQTIHPLSELPDLTGAVTIDGTSQPGFNGTPIIEIKGDNLSGANDGVSLKTSNSVIRGLVVNEMPFSDNGDSSVTGGEGIVIFSTSSFQNVGNNIVEGNFLGTDPTGTLDKGNQATGISIFDADSNLIGGTTPQARNVMSGNGDYENTNIRGVGLSITGGNHNQIKGNYIGTNATGTLKLGNTFGVFFTGLNNQFGGDEAGAGNLVSGNGTVPDPNFGTCGGGGIHVEGLVALDTGEVVTGNNSFKGNLIGTNFDGTQPLGNCQTGVTSAGNLNTSIGSITPHGRNTISGNGFDAIQCGFNVSFLVPLSGGCVIAGNNIGTDVTGNVAIPNDQRNGCVGFCILTNTVWVTPSPIDFAVVGSPGGTTPGGDCTGFCNLISGNYSQTTGGGGVYRSGFGFALIVNNYLGVNRAGTAALPNFAGFNSFYGSFAFGAALGDGNGGFIDGGNLVSGNNAQGMGLLAIEPGGTFEIKGNLIGTSKDGISAIPNGIGGTSASGISLGTQPGARAQVGGNNLLERNVIAATISDGAGDRGEGLTLGNFGSITVVNNYIGLNKFGAPLGNTASGIVASGNGSTQIGGTGANEANLIKHNGKAGVFVYRFDHPSAGITPGQNVIIRGNSIANNGGLGIDLRNASPAGFDPDGVTPNDCFDDDEGGNNLQNYPELLAPVFNVNGTVTVDGTLRSRPASNFVIDFYANGSADPSDYGEGETHLGELIALTDGNGFASFSFTSSGAVSASQKITATAMDFLGNTSEFSCYAGRCTSDTLPQAIERAAAFTCVEPIVVTVNTNESDPNTADGVCDVDTSTSGLQCSLRAAIQEANARHGLDVINFNIPSAGIQTISIPIAQQLPDITEKVLIMATSQPGYVDSPVIEVRGEVNGPQIPAVGLRIRTSDVIVSGFAINHFGINISIDSATGANENVIESNFIGMNADGMTFDPAVSSTFGISVTGNSRSNSIGGPSDFKGNVIGNCGTGLALAGAGVQNNTVTNNKIGTNKTGLERIGNQFGLVIGNGAKNNFIGNDLDNDPNLISGNFADGIGISGNSSLNRISGNLIGTNINGDMPIPNDVSGISILGGAFQNTIGGNPSQRNIISGNGGTTNPDVGFGIQLESTVHHNEIYGNYIGLKKDGSLGLGNVVGIGISGSSNTIGGVPNSPNTISSNRVGISLGTVATTPVSSNIISYNRIGTNPNGGELSSNDIGIGVVGNVHGTNINNNIISGNTAVGVLLKDGSSSNGVSNNKIGTNVDGTIPLANGIGVVVSQSDNNSITGNQVSGNTFAGLWIGDDFVQQSSAISNALKKIRSPAAHVSEAVDFTESNQVQNNLIGTNGNGTAAVPNQIAGIKIGSNARNNLIGGQVSQHKGNVISGHTLGDGGYGIDLGTLFISSSEEFPQQNKIQGNRIGIKAFSYAGLPNRKGIHIKGATDNFIGPDQNGECGPVSGDISCDDFGNIIGGNEAEAIEVVGSDSTNHVFANNFVGVAPDGTAIGNGGNGFTLSDDQSNSILDNTIGGNGGNGIEVQGSGSNLRELQSKRMAGGFGSAITQISRNIIGSRNGTGFGNLLSGIKLSNTVFVLIGNVMGGPEKNIVAANGGPGILIEGANGSDNEVRDSIVGTDENGNPGIGNGGDGIKIVDSQNTIVGADSSTGFSGNVVSGNAGNGISIEGNQTGTTALVGNIIGLVRRDFTTRKLGNLMNGIDIKTQIAMIGGVGGLRNIVGGNRGAGVRIGGLNHEVFHNNVVNNLIGTDENNTPDLGNDGDGVLISEGASLNVIGGPEPGSGNLIANNGGAGVALDPTAGPGNLIDPNSIHGNAGLGIDLGSNGHTPNDPGDGDLGPNQLQNFPEFGGVSIDTSGNLVVQYSVNSAPGNSNYGTSGLYIELFKADASLQGKTFVGSTHYTASDYTNGAPGTVSFNAGNAAGLGISNGDKLVATATDADNNTSEFTSTNVGVVGGGSCPAITLSPSSLPAGTVGSSYNQSLSASGGAEPYTFAVTVGGLPEGLTLNSSGEISGAPTTANGSPVNFTITATDANNCTGTQNYSVAINCPTITVSPVTLPDGTVGLSYNQTVTAGGISGPFNFVVNGGDLPTGLTLDATTGQITGTPSTTSGSPFSFTITATNSASGCAGSRGYSINILAAPVPVIIAAGASLTSESCPPNNNVVDPGERVSLNLSLTNNGNAGTSNLVAALQVSSNVIVPTGPQTYGELTPGNSVARLFTFTADGPPGSTIPVTLQLQDGATNLGSATFNVTLGSNSTCRIPRLIVTSTLQRINGTTVKASYTVQNAGAVTADNLQLTAAKLGTALGTPVPQSLGGLAGGATSVPMDVFFTNSTSGANSSLTLAGTYTGGNFNTTKRITLP